MSQLPAPSTYLGSWTDWTQGRVYGATITLSRVEGNLLQSFLAIFTTLAFTQLWTITAFVVYCARSNKTPQDGLSHQQKAVLRNSTSLMAAWTFARQGWAWHNKVRRAAIRSLGWASFAVAFAIAAFLAGIFTAYATDKATLNRLVVSDNCGYWTATTDGSETTFQATTALKNATSRAVIYARDCYDQGAGALQCSQFVRPNLTWTTTDTKCPFDQSLCNSTVYSTQAVAVNISSVVDSLDDLGINSPPSERLRFQTSWTCSPVLSSQEYTIVNNTTPAEWLMNYGPIQNTSNYTLRWLDLGRAAQLGYGVTPVASYAGSINGWIPISALQRTDADTNIVFVSANSVYYNSSNNDPIFGAGKVGQGSTASYIPVWPVTVMACAQQYRTCNPASSTCSPWMGALQLRNVSESNVDTKVVPHLWPNHGLSANQVAINERYARATINMGIYQTVSLGGVSPLRLENTLIGLWQSADVPDNQWVSELQGWFEASLARLQGEIRDFAVGPVFLPENSLTRTRGDQYTQALCEAQLTKNVDNTMNFSVLAISLIFGLGGLFIILGLGIESVFNLIVAKWPKYAYKKEVWRADGYLQGHRRGFGEKDMMEWNTGDIPTTQEPRKVPHFEIGSDGSTDRLLEEDDVEKVDSQTIRRKPLPKQRVDSTDSQG